MLSPIILTPICQDALVLEDLFASEFLKGACGKQFGVAFDSIAVVVIEYEADVLKGHASNLDRVFAVSVGERLSIPFGLIAFLEPQSDTTSGALLHHVVAPVSAEYEDIISSATMKQIIARSANDDVIARRPNYAVVASISEQPVVTFVRPDDIVSVAASDS